MTVFEPYLRQWRLERDGEAFRSQSSDLIPVRSSFGSAILKVPFVADERFGGILLRRWNGEGAARLFHFDEASGAMVLERASGLLDLRRMSEEGADEAAVRILCATAGRLHARRREPLPNDLIPLRDWFGSLRNAASVRGEPFSSAWTIAERLLADEREIVVLHGDIHHGNVLDFGRRGWLAIDPKHVFGERTFDYINILRNPDPERMPDPSRFARTVSIVVEEAGLDRRRYLEWTRAFALLSAAWIMEDGGLPSADFEVARLAEAMLGSNGVAIP